MTTRRTFITGLLATGATGAAQPVPAQPVAEFLGATAARTYATRAMLQASAFWTLNGVYGKLASPTGYAALSQPDRAALLDKLYQVRRQTKVRAI